jgi:hypothetical protein
MFVSKFPSGLSALFAYGLGDDNHGKGHNPTISSWRECLDYITYNCIYGKNIQHTYCKTEFECLNIISEIFRVLDRGRYKECKDFIIEMVRERIEG